MTRTAFLPALALSLAVVAPACARAGTFRCQLPSGQIEYRDTPCAQGTQRVIDTTPATGPAPPMIGSATPSAHEEHKEHWHPGGPPQRSADRYSFAHMRMGVRQALELLAPGPDGNLRVVVDPSITAVGMFDYHDVTLPVLLADIAERFNLDISNEHGVITARPR